jgi:hypothetical protein
MTRREVNGGLRPYTMYPFVETETLIQVTVPIAEFDSDGVCRSTYDEIVVVDVDANEKWHDKLKIVGDAIEAIL